MYGTSKCRSALGIALPLLATTVFASVLIGGGIGSPALARDGRGHETASAQQSTTPGPLTGGPVEVAASEGGEGGFQKVFRIDIGNQAASRAMFLPEPPPGKVTVQLLATSVGDKTPGEFSFHFAAPEMKELFHTVSEPKGKTVLRGPLVKDGIVFVEPGKFYTLQVIYENPTDRQVRFLVNAPMVDPSAALPYARARCWCAAIPFLTPANGTFSRTIQVGVGPETPPGAKAIVEWPVVSLK